MRALAWARGCWWGWGWPTNGHLWLGLCSSSRSLGARSLHRWGPRGRGGCWRGGCWRRRGHRGRMCRRRLCGRCGLRDGPVQSGTWHVTCDTHLILLRQHLNDGRPSLSRKCDRRRVRRWLLWLALVFRHLLPLARLLCWRRSPLRLVVNDEDGFDTATTRARLTLGACPPPRPRPPPSWAA
jgi:hypothetical protein